jgi:hypothetical protein
MMFMPFATGILDLLLCARTQALLKHQLLFIFGHMHPQVTSPAAALGMP